jgi:hypothetical protein
MKLIIIISGYRVSFVNLDRQKNYLPRRYEDRYSVSFPQNVSMLIQIFYYVDTWK